MWPYQCSRPPPHFLFVGPYPLLWLTFCSQTADPAWSVAYPNIATWAAGYYSDDRLVERHYEGIKAYADSETRQLEPNGILSYARYG